MIWGSMSWGGIGKLEFIEGTMTKEDYLDLLRRNLRPSAAKVGLGRRFTFQLDGYPNQTAKIIPK